MWCGFISIHAPTRGATINCGCVFTNHSISIHAPTRGATCIFYLIRVIFILFQSTLPREERLCITTSPPRVTLFQSTLPREERQLTDCTFFCASKISIHAPTRGATVMHFKTSFSFDDFNPRSHERSDAVKSCLHLYP